MNVKRRTVLGGLFALVTAAVTASGRVAAAAAVAPPAAPRAAGPVGGSGNAKTWRWVALPDSGGLQVYVTDARGTGSLPVAWTADGVVTVKGLTATAGYLSSGNGYGLNVRRA